MGFSSPKHAQHFHKNCHHVLLHHCFSQDTRQVICLQSLLPKTCRTHYLFCFWIFLLPSVAIGGSALHQIMQRRLWVSAKTKILLSTHSFIRNCIFWNIWLIRPPLVHNLLSSIQFTTWNLLSIVRVQLGLLSVCQNISKVCQKVL